MHHNRSTMAARTATSDDFIRFIRSSAPYIHAHRGCTFVLGIGGEAIADRRFPELMQDVALLHSLGVRLVLTHGARPQVDQRLAAAGVKTRVVRGRRITTKRALEHVKDAVGSTRVAIEAALSMGLPNTPMAGASIRVAAGNFVTAQPVGVVNGIDHEFTGDVRRVDVEAVRQRLDAGAVVLLSAIGFSLTGEAFNVPHQAVASAAARALGADKLLLLAEDALSDSRRKRIGELSPEEADELVRRRRLPLEMRLQVQEAVFAVRHGVGRAHLVPRSAVGGILRELFTREGAGTMVAPGWGSVRRATLADVGGILSLIESLADSGLLLRRPREVVEHEIDRFAVIVQDGMVVACGALRPYSAEGMCEIAAMAVHPAYRGGGRGQRLLEFLEAWAHDEGFERLFTLTTQTMQWFKERGFVSGRVTDLPEERRAVRSRRRNSKVLIKQR